MTAMPPSSVNYVIPGACNRWLAAVSWSCISGWFKCGCLGGVWSYDVLVVIATSRSGRECLNRSGYCWKVDLRQVLLVLTYLGKNNHLKVEDVFCHVLPIL